MFAIRIHFRLLSSATRFGSRSATWSRDFSNMRMGCYYIERTKHQLFDAGTEDIGGTCSGAIERCYSSFVWRCDNGRETMSKRSEGRKDDGPTTRLAVRLLDRYTWTEPSIRRTKRSIEMTSDRRSTAVVTCVSFHRRDLDVSGTTRRRDASRLRRSVSVM